MAEYESLQLHSCRSWYAPSNATTFHRFRICNFGRDLTHPHFLRDDNWPFDNDRASEVCPRTSRHWWCDLEMLCIISTWCSIESGGISPNLSALGWRGRTITLILCTTLLLAETSCCHMQSIFQPKMNWTLKFWANEWIYVIHPYHKQDSGRSDDLRRIWALVIEPSSWSLARNYCFDVVRS